MEPCPSILEGVQEGRLSTPAGQALACEGADGHDWAEIAHVHLAAFHRICDQISSCRC